MPIPYEALDARTYNDSLAQSVDLGRLRERYLYTLYLKMQTKPGYNHLPGFVSVGTFVRIQKPEIISGPVAVHLCLADYFGVSASTIQGLFDPVTSIWEPDSVNVIGFREDRAGANRPDLSTIEARQLECDKERGIVTRMASQAVQGYIVEKQPAKPQAIRRPFNVGSARIFEPVPVAA